MGVKDFIPFIRDLCPSAIKKVPFQALRGKTLAIDATLLTQRFHFARAAEQREVKNGHVLGWYNLISELKRNDIKPICIFDGKGRNAAKLREAQRRQQHKAIGIARSEHESRRAERLAKLHSLIQDLQELSPEEQKKHSKRLKKVVKKLDLGLQPPEEKEEKPKTKKKEKKDKKDKKAGKSAVEVLPLEDEDKKTASLPDTTSDEMATTGMDQPKISMEDAIASIGPTELVYPNLEVDISDVEGIQPVEASTAEQAPSIEVTEESVIADIQGGSEAIPPSTPVQPETESKVDGEPLVYETVSSGTDSESAESSDEGEMPAVATPSMPDAGKPNLQERLLEAFTRYQEETLASSTSIGTLTTTSSSSSTPAPVGLDADAEQVQVTQDSKTSQIPISASKLQNEIAVEEAELMRTILDDPEQAPRKIMELQEKSENLNDSYRRYANHPTERTFQDVKYMLKAMGAPCVKSSPTFEGEGLASALVLKGFADYVVSEDSDVIVYNAPILRNLTDRRNDVTIITASEVRKALGLSKKTFIDFALLCGTDFTERIKGFGPKKAYPLIQTHKSIEKLLSEETKIASSLDDVDEFLKRVQAARKIFKTLPELPKEEELMQKEPDEDKVKELLKEYEVERFVNYKGDGEENALQGNYFGDNPHIYDPEDPKYASTQFYY